MWYSRGREAEWTYSLLCDCKATSEINLKKVRRVAKRLPKLAANSCIEKMVDSPPCSLLARDLQP